MSEDWRELMKEGEFTCTVQYDQPEVEEDTYRKFQEALFGQDHFAVGSLCTFSLPNMVLTGPVTERVVRDGITEAVLVNFKDHGPVWIQLTTEKETAWNSPK